MLKNNDSYKQDGSINDKSNTANQTTERKMSLIKKIMLNVKEFLKAASNSHGMTGCCDCVSLALQIEKMKEESKNKDIKNAQK
ncbi:MAG: hypothetical protein LBV66_01280 [Elusimicrobiota bacterium]|jgi:hypothetical protein|nr:hypothetical protein [Elusimicrobiota bacterium]